MPYSYNEVGAVLPDETITVTYPFLSRDHVSVKVDGVLVSTSLWSWVNDGLITALTGFPSGTKTKVYRTTPISQKEATLLGAAVFDFGSVNTNDLQLLYALQEAVDRGDLHQTTLDNFMAQVEQVAADAVQVAADADTAEAARVAAVAAAAGASGAIPVPDRAALKALDTASKKSAIIYGEGGRNGLFSWRTANYSAQVTADTLEGIYIKADAVAATSGAWVREYDGPADISWWAPAGDGVTDDRQAFQAAYDTLADKAELLITAPAVGYTLSSTITLSGTKRLLYTGELGTLWTLAADHNEAIGGEQVNNYGNLWPRQIHYTDHRETSGGVLGIFARHKSTAAPAPGYQWDAVRIHATTEDVSETGNSKACVALGVFSYGTASNTNAALWGINPYCHIPLGGDGTMRGVEVNLSHDGGALVQEPGDPLNKIGFMATTKITQCTAGFYAGKGGGNGWYKGFITEQSALVNAGNSRAFEYTDLFEVMYDGRVLVGKGATSTLGLAGSEISPTGGAIFTATGAGATIQVARTETMSAVATSLGSLTGLAQDSAGNSTTFAGVVLVSQDGTDGAEAGRIQLNTAVAGTYALRGYVGGGLVMGSPTGGDKGAGTVNATAVYDDNVLLTDYVFDFSQDGQVREEDGKLGRKFAKRAKRLLDLDRFASFWRKNRHLPSMPSREEWRKKGKHSVGDLVQRLWETVEIQAVHIQQLNERLKALES